ncbi:membrane-associated protein, putative [Bodo saltans]|uniref:Membrane-associated protein, putative n=1 Tax=Bodo saltans TaxID=75058 RepID=A0A0S4J2Q6_BODSA|nr:membrane-associated protein, putative [Bodo saltans]|eukprot:CUG27054.1 membrane-associated protein, putative [Bodo saltans]
MGLLLHRVRFVLFLSIQLLFLRSCDALFTFSLINGNNTAGLLQVRSMLYDAITGYGTVCGTFDGNAATVACASVGLPGYVGRVVPVSLFGVGFGRIMMSNVQCPSTAFANLNDCAYSNESTTTCTHEQDVAISCTYPTTTAPQSSTASFGGGMFKLEYGSSGRLLFRPSDASSSQWSVVCKAGSPADQSFASAGCRSLDTQFSGSGLGFGSASPSGYSTALIVTQCSSFDNTTISNCIGYLGPSSLCHTTGGAVSLNSALTCTAATYVMRLTNVNADNIGLLEVRPSANWKWGRVCHNRNSNNGGVSGLSATVLCRLAGYPGTIGAVVPRPASLASDESPQSPVYLSSVNCPSSQTKSILQCQLSTNATLCTPEMNVYLQCAVPVTQNAASWEFQLVNSRDVFLLRPNASVPWGELLFSTASGYPAGTTALAACRSVGRWFSYGAGWTSASDTFTRRSGIHYMLDVECNSRARNLSECAFSVPTATTVSVTQYAIQLICSTSLQLSLGDGTVSSRTAYGGLLELSTIGASYYMTPVTGNVCWDAFATTELATRACNALFPGRAGVLTTRYGNGFRNENQFSEVNCSDALSVNQCRANRPLAPCSSVVGVDCVVPTSSQNTFEVKVGSISATNTNVATATLLFRPNVTAPWLPMSFDSLTPTVGAVLCLEIGYLQFLSIQVPSTNSTTSYVAPLLSCISGTTPLSRCLLQEGAVRPVQQRTYSYPYALRCSQPQARYFLSGPRSTEGLVYGVMNYLPVTGSICSSSSLVNDTAATSMCSLVGFPGYIGSARSLGAGSGMIFTSNCLSFTKASSISCLSPTTLVNNFTNSDGTMCSHQNDLGLYCAVPSLTSPSTTRLQIMLTSSVTLVRRSASEPWGGLCYDDTTTVYYGQALGRAICATLGFVNFTASFASMPTPPPMNVTGPSFGNFVCADVYNLTNLGQCFYDVSATPCASYARAQCAMVPQWSLRGGTDGLSGNVFVRPGIGDSPWGVLCGRANVSVALATAHCTRIGFVGYEGTVGPIFDAKGGPNYGYIDAFGELQLNPFPANANPCADADIVSISCRKQQAPDAWEYSLPQFGSSTTSPLMVRPLGSSVEWGYIGSMSPYFNLVINPTVACRSVNPDAVVPGYLSQINAPSTGIIYFSAVGCLPDVRSIGECALNRTKLFSNQSRLGILVLSCNYNQPWAWRFNGTSKPGFYSGRLEVQPAGDPVLPWGTVCFVGLQNIASICPRMLGFSGNGLVGKVLTEGNAGGSGPVYLSDLSCPDTANSIGLCSFSNQTATAAKSGTSCTSHANDLAIECAPPQPDEWTYAPIEGCNIRTQYCNIMARAPAAAADAPGSALCYSYLLNREPAWQFLCNSFALGSTPYLSSKLETVGASPTSSSFVQLSCATGLTNYSQCLRVPVSRCTDDLTVQLKCSGSMDLRYSMVNKRTTSSGSTVGIIVASSQVVGVRGVVCSSGGFADPVALSRVCRTVGFDGMVARVIASPLIPAASIGYKVLLDSVACKWSSQADDASLTSVGYCTPTLTSGTCTTTVEVECSLPIAAQSTWSIQRNAVINQAPRTMFLRPNSSAPWGMMCASSYYYPGRFFNEVEKVKSLVCDELFPNQRGLLTMSPGTSNYPPGPPLGNFPIYTSRIFCSANASALSECIFDSYERTSCSIYQDVRCVPAVTASTVAFRLRPISTILSPDANTTFGVLEMKPVGQTLWGTMCRATDTDGAMLCQRAGYFGSTATLVQCPASTSDVSAGMPIYTTSQLDSMIPLPGLVADPNLCNHVINDTCLVCASTPPKAVIAPSTTSSTTMPSSNQATWSVDRNSDSGLVYIRPNSSMAWGLVCSSDRLWTFNESMMFCRWLGCTDRCTAQWSVRSLGSLYGSVFADQIRCPAGASNLQQCTFYEFLDAVSPCASTSAATLTCLPYSPPQTYAPGGGGTPGSTQSPKTGTTTTPPTPPTPSRTATFVISSNTQLDALKAAISSHFNIQVTVTVVSTNPGANESATNATTTTTVLVEFPTAADCSQVVLAANNANSEFSSQNPFILSATVRQTSDDGETKGGGGGTDESSSDNTGAIVGGVIGGLAAIAGIGAAVYVYRQREALKNNGQKAAYQGKNLDALSDDGDEKEPLELTAVVVAHHHHASPPPPPSLPTPTVPIGETDLHATAKTMSPDDIEL